MKRNKMVNARNSRFEYKIYEFINQQIKTAKRNKTGTLK